VIINVSGPLKEVEKYYFLESLGKIINIVGNNN
jgi:hypothetical protein